MILDPSGSTYFFSTCHLYCSHVDWLAVLFFQQKLIKFFLEALQVKWFLVIFSKEIYYTPWYFSRICFYNFITCIKWFFVWKICRVSRIVLNFYQQSLLSDLCWVGLFIYIYKIYKVDASLSVFCFVVKLLNLVKYWTFVLSFIF